MTHKMGEPIRFAVLPLCARTFQGTSQEQDNTEYQHGYGYLTEGKSYSDIQQNILMLLKQPNLNIKH